MSLDLDQIESLVRTYKSKRITRENTVADGFAVSILSLISELREAREDIQALTHEGRQGELEQGNVGLADENRILSERLQSAEKALILCRDIFKYKIDTDVGSISDKDGYARARAHFERFKEGER